MRETMEINTTTTATADVATRWLYACAADPEASVPAGELLEEVRAELRGNVPVAPASLDDLLRRAADWASAERVRFRELGDRTQDDESRRVLVRRAALGCAPLALASGAWLQWLSAPGNADDDLVLRVLALYASDVGVGHPGASRGDAYLDLLRRLRLSENAVPLARLAGDPRIADGAFTLPSLLLVMSRRPDDFRGELLGADLCLRTVGLPPPLALVERALPVAADWPVIDPSAARRPEDPPPAEECRAVVADLVAREGRAAEAAVLLGLSWTLAALREHTDALHAELTAAADPAYDMAELMRLRAREGAVYHHEFELEGRSLAAWLTDARTDPSGLLAALARSRLVKPGRSSASALVRGLVGERGPMFRVFSPDDLTVIRRWIDSLPADSSEAAPPKAPDGDAAARPPGTAVARALRAGPWSEGRAPADLREAYHLLMVRTDTPALRSWCLEYVHGWLARSRYGMDGGAMPLPASWGSAGLRPWLQTQHDRHGAEFERNAEVPLPSREDVIDDTVQTAPLTLIDGSWLQGFTDHELASSDIGHALFQTYWDELGNGLAKLNHPLIYRAVLKEMAIDLPPTASPEFARWPGFRDESFELPVYWLCVGRFPRTFLPEVLGLNLAMELSGVGGTYRRARLALKRYGFNTRFVDIHNTIDNVATGHSAWAADAVDILLAGLPEAPGPGSRAETWERVRTGYRSLNPPSGLGARRAARRATRRGRIAPLFPFAGRR
ncbi:iron-containing redox enzyme family protein [Herbidospora sp. NBRC 101105]|uniref:iron-containing redox enzyme family protein n=1 Tax=Herbidospora sp. NBRC 101105 TaxID=3032195 RepID=UPI002552B4BF|nr:iron-containing redox enzyme family protein [Herbidospora sp. NBRC 101105]